MMQAREPRRFPSLASLVIAVLAVKLLIAATSTAESPASTQGSEQRASAAPGMVTVQVVLRGKDGQLVNNAGHEQFRLFEDGKEQQIALFSQPDPQPLNIALLMQWSGVRRDELPYGEIGPASQFFRPLMRNHDAAFVARFSDKVTPLSDFVEDPTLIEESIRRAAGAKLEGRTALYDAMIWACQQKLMARSGRRVLVVVTSGIDAIGTDSDVKKSRDDALKAALQTETAIYSINLAYTNPHLPSQTLTVVGKSAADVSKKTGGDIIFVHNQDDFNRAFALIAAELRGGYVFGYYPTNSNRDGKFRKINIKPLDKDIHVQAHEGYYSS